MNIPSYLEVCKGIGFVTPAATIACMAGVLVVQAVATKQAESWAKKLWNKLWGKK